MTDPGVFGGKTVTCVKEGRIKGNTSDGLTTDGRRYSIWWHQEPNPKYEKDTKMSQLTPLISRRPIRLVYNTF